MKRHDDKFMSMVRIGPKGQIVIPKEVREMFGLEPGDSLVLLADKQRGIALQKSSVYERIINAVFDGRASEVLPEQTEAEAQVFAEQLKAELEGSGER